MFDTIAAVATAQGRGGVAIVRVSGEDALAIAKKMFSRKGEFTPNVLYPGRVDCGEFTDYGMCVYFRAPRSFTGEDVAEFHLHGGAEIARGALKKALSSGARLAEAGEFTKRAYLNGKLSLSAVEGMGEMINARSAAQVRAGFGLYSEKLSRKIGELRSRIGHCLAGTDAEVDFPEEDLDAETREETIRTLLFVEKEIETLLSGYSAGKKIKTGVSVALCGRPNAGKSSLFNALLGYDRAIVSAVAGTTRDLVEGELEIDGVLFRLTDTAGLRAGADEVEREGIRRAERALEGADVIVYLREEGDEVSFPEGIPVIVVGAKSDLGPRENCDVSLSAVTGEGIETLKKLLYERGFGAEEDGAFLLEERHFSALREALAAVKETISAAREGLFAELYAEPMRRAYVALGEIGGETASEEIVAEIFSSFCVGK